ncbi:MAG TPA: Holliday junction branch migration protein RuvA [Candidatus Saccharimonadia bacterium]|jgi:Holliday junction DNA helicase RuvA
MIASLTGTIAEKLPDSLILEVGGVGYELFVTTDEWGGAGLGSEAKFYVHEQVREDAFNLYGFTALASKQLFTRLIGVNSVGPKLAMQILSSAGESRLRQAIASGDPALLKGITGVGPKTAQRVILDLRGKVEEGSTGLAPVADSTYQALVALGYTPAQATQAVAALPADVTDEQARLKLALKGVGE